MSEIAVRVEELSKQYRIGGSQASYKTLRESLIGAARAPFGRLRRSVPASTARGQPSQAPNDTIWALKDVSLSVQHGEVVGLIGRNGAGKSTLLKILSRITRPTEGRAVIKGRVGSLLEVGTGFHPELTGRENVYLNGAILGMHRTEIDHKFDEIVAFAEIEKFLDTPVKHYSSGMYVRLAFAVAAHLEPEILLVDEVLAVGDAAFQKKCLGKMGDVVQEGRTVLFVSHNMRAIKSLCSRVILLEGGELVLDDQAEVAIARYLSTGVSEQSEIEWAPEDAPGTSEFRLRAIRLGRGKGEAFTNLSTLDPIAVEIHYDLLAPLRGVRVHIKLLTQDGAHVFSSSDSPTWPDSRPQGRYLSRCLIPGHLLNVGTYILTVGADIPDFKALLRSREYLRFTVSELMDNPMGLSSKRVTGIINPKLEWTVEQVG
jgi:lipopolysaccharide transport system ATP-binding protein